MGEPAVSVVVPTYNRSSLLARLLGALQRCEPPAGGLEVIVVDDGSSDDTGAVVRDVAPWARYLRQDNAGPAAARNRGWRASSAPRVAFTDDDCVPDRRWLVELVAELPEAGGIAGVGGTVLPLVDGFVARFVQLERLVDHGRDGDFVRFLVTANAAYRTNVLEQVGGFDEGFPTAAGEDTDLSWRVRNAGYALALAPAAVVLHDHRSSARGLLKTYFRHGQARVLLAHLHPDEGVGSAARSMLFPRYWVQRYRYYRNAGPASRVSSAAYTLMRAAGLTAYTAGIVSGRRATT